MGTSTVPLDFVSPPSAKTVTVTTGETESKDYSSFAVAFCEGVATDVLRMWANGTLIYDKTGSSDDVVNYDLTFRFYGGTETQEPDALIQKDIGADSTPAFRGLCYIVFENFPLEDFSNSIPSIVAEITANADYTDPVVYDDPIDPAEGGAATQLFVPTPDYNRNIYYCSDDDQILRRFDAGLMVETRQQSFSTDAVGAGVGGLRVICVTDQGYIVARTGEANKIPISVINPDTWEITSTFGTYSLGFPSDSPSGFAFLQGSSCDLTLNGNNGNRYFALVTSYTTRLGILEVTNGEASYLWDSDTFGDIITPPLSSHSRIKGVCSGGSIPGLSEAWAILGPRYSTASSDNFSIYLITITTEAGYEQVYNHETLSDDDIVHGVTIGQAASLAPGDVISGETSLYGLSAPIYDETDGNIMFVVGNSDASSEYLVKYDTKNSAILWSTVMPVTDVYRASMNNSKIKDGVFGFVNGSTRIAVDTLTGEIILQETTSRAADDGPGWWDSKKSSFLGKDASDSMAKWKFFRYSSDGVTLGSVVADLTDRVGVDASDIDVTDINSLTIPGYAVKQRGSVRSAIEPLSTIYNFDCVETDYVLSFVKRDGVSSSATISQSDLVLPGSGEYIRESRTQEVELPSAYSITYMDEDNNYEQAIHSAKRILSPNKSVYSNNEKNVTINASLDSDFAKQAAEKNLYSSWVGRSAYGFNLPWKYMTLDPSDIVTVNLDDGTEIYARLYQTEIGKNFEIGIDAISETTAQYTSTVTSDSGTHNVTQVLTTSVETKLILLNTPLLSDGYDLGRAASIQFYAMGGYYDGNWNGARLFGSSDDTSFDYKGRAFKEMVWGYASNALGDTDTPFSTDETNTLTVFINSGSDQMESATQIDMLNGANVAAIIDSSGNAEIIQFRDVAQNSDSSFTLSGLLRGRRGTEVFTGSHSVGDVFVVLTTTVLGSTPIKLSQQDSTIYYRAVPVNRQITDATSQASTTPMNDLKPYAPSVYSATNDGSNNVTIDWFRRTRIGGALVDYYGTVPLSEDTEEYEIDIYSGSTENSPSGEIVRTVTGLTSPSYTYSAANQAADGLSVPLSDITVKVYQVSAQVGRGFSKEITLEVI